MGVFNKLFCEPKSFSQHCNPHRFLESEVLRLYSLCRNPRLCGLSCSLVVPPGLSTCECGTTWSTSPCAHSSPPYTSSPTSVLQLPPCHASSLPWLHFSAHPACLNECSSLTPWLLDFHTVRFLGSSGYFLFFKLLLSFFWLCKEAKCIYQCLHLGWKSQLHISNPCFLHWCSRLYSTHCTVYGTGLYFDLIILFVCLLSIVWIV